MSNIPGIEKLALENIIALLPGHVYWKDINGKYLGCNDMQAKSLGLNSRDEIVNRIAYQDLPKEIAENLRKNDQEILKSKAPRVKEEPGVRSDGSLGTFISHKIPLLGKNQEPLGLLGVSLDITLKKEAEVKLKAANAVMQKANKVKRALLSAISQEIRSPLSNIMGMAQILQNYKHSSEQLKRIKIIEQSARNIIPILDRINYYLDLESSQNHSNKFNDVLNLHAFFLSIVKEHEDEMARKNVKTIKDFSSEIPVKLKTNASLLFEVINNILSNAVKYSSNREIFLGTKYEVFANSNIINVFISIKDQGPGISLKKQQALFNFFNFEKNISEADFQDSGIKLSLTKAIVNIMGGQLTLNSDGMTGSEFIIKLPFEVPIEGAKKSSHHSTSLKIHQMVDYSENESLIEIKRSHLDVLLIEDNPLNQIVLKLMIEENFDCTVDTAETVKSGTNKTKTKNYDLILCDLNLPDRSGIDFAKDLLKRCGDNAPLLVGVTAYLSDSEISKCYNSGFLEVLPKPVTTEMLSALFETIWLDKNEAS